MKPVCLRFAISFGMVAAGDFNDVRGEMFNLNGLGLGKPPAASVCLCDLNLITYLVKLGQILPLPGTFCAFFNKHNPFFWEIFLRYIQTTKVGTCTIGGGRKWGSCNPRCLVTKTYCLFMQV
jgi:hypothetical protein